MRDNGTSTTSSNVLRHLYDGVQAIVNELAREHDAAGTPKVELTRPTDEKFGDYATNVALMLAPVVRGNPQQIAQRIAERVRELDGVRQVDVAGPGFVNLTLEDSWFHSTLQTLAGAGEQYGSGVVDKPQSMLVEYVSANPTGPLHAATARHAAYGDSLRRLLQFAGHEVATEFYVNDQGKQIDLFGQSIKARAMGTDVPENGYQGDYVKELATALGAGTGDDPTELGSRGVEAMLEQVKPQLQRFGVEFDRFQSERELHDSGLVEEALEQLRSLGQLYDQDGATWLRSTAFGDDKDRTVMRSNGVPTYFAADIGYLLHKYRRGVDHLLLVLGADHHGYVARLRAAAIALGYSAESCEIVIMQMVHLLEGGEQKKMSKRRGDFVTMDELIERIGVDAARFLLVQRSHDQSIELDLELAVEQSSQNPVYYVQYAHARICSIVRKVVTDLGEQTAAELDEEQLRGLASIELDPAERRLIKRLAEFPVLVRESADKRSPHKVTHYAHDLASDFTTFYRDCRVVGEGVSRETTMLRLAICRASRTVLARSLDLVGVSAPEAM